MREHLKLIRCSLRASYRGARRLKSDKDASFLHLFSIHIGYKVWLPPSEGSSSLSNSRNLSSDIVTWTACFGLSTSLILSDGVEYVASEALILFSVLFN